MPSDPGMVYDPKLGKMVPDPNLTPEEKRKIDQQRKARAQSEKAALRAQRKKRKGSCTSRLFTILILLVLIIATPFVIGYVYQLASAQNENFVPMGQVVSVPMDNGTYNMHLHCIGAGSPTVILDADIGAWSVHWEDVQTEIAKFTRVCSYDRAGYGWSDRNPAPRTIQRMATELYLLLQVARERGPYVMVGHGVAGMTARAFAQSFQNDVRGVVLVDSMSESLLTPYPATYNQQITFFKVAEFFAPWGTVRLVDQLLRYDNWLLQGASLSAEYSPVFRAGYYKPAYWETVWAELADLSSAPTELANIGGLGSKPLVVIIATDRSPNSFPPPNASYDAQQVLARLSTQSELVEAQTAHYIHLQNPTLFLIAIQNVVQQAR
ncbi:MAG: alpha/beta hydrolase [Phototrophicales bacterium]|nr:alpha/beta hydrolase [Phototrophicales bacterium]